MKDFSLHHIHPRNEIGRESYKTSTKIPIISEAHHITLIESSVVQSSPLINHLNSIIITHKSEPYRQSHNIRHNQQYPFFSSSNDVSHAFAQESSTPDNMIDSSHVHTSNMITEPTESQH
jgi:hypothetical protein